MNYIFCYFDRILFNSYKINHIVNNSILHKLSIIFNKFIEQIYK